MTFLLQQLMNGLIIAAVIGLVAVGITMVFGLSGTVNFAHGQMVALGAYATWQIGSFGAPFLIAAGGGVAVCVVVSFLLERFCFRYTYSVPMKGFVASLGLIIIFSAIFQKVWGLDPRGIQSPWSGLVTVGGVHVPIDRIVVLVGAALLVVALQLWLRLSDSGRTLRACADDRESAALVGVPVEKVLQRAFVFGGALAGFAGAMVLLLFSATPDTGQTYLIKAFAVALVGGLGNITGTLIAAVILGLAEALGAGYIETSWQNAYALIVLVAVLMVRPSGLRSGFNRAT